MATLTAARMMRSFPQRFGLNTTWSSAIFSARRNFYTGDRYQGYVSYFQADELFGFVVREDVPDKEYYFHSTDLHTRNVPRVRPLQQVEFSIVEGRGGNHIAREITGPSGQDLEFQHPNMRLSPQDRTQTLSSLPNGMHERHKGVVISIHPDQSGGLIVPDRLNFDVCNFRMSELQTTGFERIDRFAEVEFFVRPGPAEGARDRAVCITRPGGGLITSEKKEVGSRRRQLGAMYGPNDVKARLTNDFLQGRERGIVTQFFNDKMFGFIAPIDNPSDGGIFVHCDDCHMAGKRILQKNQMVEFKRMTDSESNRTKALHVTGINQTVLHPISPNHYLPRDLTTQEFDPDSTTRHLGEVTRIEKEQQRWLVIKPRERGYAPVFAFRNELVTLGQRRVNVGELVEFSVAPNENKSEDGENHDVSGVKAVNITGEGGFPLITVGGMYGKYLQTKITMPVRQFELSPPPLTSGNQTLKGYVSAYSRTHGSGTIEIEAPDGERYQKCKFSINDCVLPKNMDPSLAMINVGLVIKCSVGNNELTEEEKEIAEKGGTTLTRKALNITSIDLDELQCREYMPQEERTEDSNRFERGQQKQY